MGAFNKKLLKLVAGLVVIFIFLQFTKLATVGRLGSQISEVRAEQKKYELENELIRSEISELKITSNIEIELKKDPSLVTKDVTVLSGDKIEEIVAQN